MNSSLASVVSTYNGLSDLSVEFSLSLFALWLHNIYPISFGTVVCGAAVFVFSLLGTGNDRQNYQVGGA